MSTSHTHTPAHLDPEAQALLVRGLRRLLEMTEGLSFRPLNSEKHPLPLAHLAYAATPEPEAIRRELAARLESDPVGVLDLALALLELYESNQPGIAEHLPEDMPFVRACFNSKRCSGWGAVMGGEDRAEVEAALNARGQFRFYHGPERETGVYVLLNLLARYAYVYGRIPYGDGHALGHFVEDHCPGVLVCRPGMTDLEHALSLAAMKMGVPAVVSSDYPFALGRKLAADTPEEIAAAVVAFPNVRRLLSMPGVPPLPDYCRPEFQGEKVEPTVTWGDTPESFYLARKGRVTAPGTSVSGTPGSAMGVVVTLEGEPLDAFDLGYIERSIVGTLSMVSGVAARCEEGRLVVGQAAGANLDPRQIGEVLLAAIGRGFPRLARAHVEILFERERLAAMAPGIRAEREAREAAVRAATEENVPGFYACVACSPFAPDHVCVLTPERHPQCGRPYEMIKTGALYGFDDTSNIHHSALHREINSFRAIEKGDCLDPVRGEWSGINDAARTLTHGRTTRVQLHAVDAFPHTGCGCFRLILFQTEAPRPGIGIVDTSFEGRCPDGRNWRDLHYDLGGKQAPGMAGAPPSYLSSPKFLRAHGGWESIVWVSPKVAEMIGSRLPEGVAVG